MAICIIVPPPGSIKPQRSHVPWEKQWTDWLYETEKDDKGNYQMMMLYQENGKAKEIIERYGKKFKAVAISNQCGGWDYFDSVSNPSGIFYRANKYR